MEELQSTEILDREILEDARKKALRILKQAEDTVNAGNAQWEKKINDGIAELEKKYSQESESQKITIMARLPVDKLRVKIGKIEEFLGQAVESWYKNLSRSMILEILSKELSKRIEYCKDQIKKGDSFTAVAFGLEQNEADVIIKSVKNTIQSLSINNDFLSSPVKLSAARMPSFTLVCGDIRITASIEKTIDFILQEKREELASSLVGHDFLGTA